MASAKRILTIAFRLFAFSLFCLSIPLLARQEPQPAAANAIGPRSPIIAAVSGETVRFISPGTTAQIRVRILSAGEDVVYDSSWKDGDVLDWGSIDRQGQPLASGSYRCVIEVRDLQGQVSQREAMLIAQGGRLTLEAAAGSETLIVLGAEDGGGPKVTLLAHDGANGAIVSTSGDLSFRFGNFLAGKDNERMHLTAEGNLGIGTDSPQARLDVNGMIRTSKGIQFPDGTVLTTAAGLIGTGIADGGGVLRRHPSSPDSPVASGTPNREAEVRQRVVQLNSPAVPAPRLTPHPNTGPGYQFVVDSTGVHIGTTSSYGLNVAGDVSTGTQYNLRGAPFASRPCINCTALGYLAGHAATGQLNTFLGEFAGESNPSGGGNVVVGASAGQFLSSGETNTLIGTQAGSDVSSRITTESANTLIGFTTGVSAGVTHSTAIGYGAIATQSFTVILGSVGSTSTGIGTYTPNQRLGVGGGITVDENNANNGTLLTNGVIAFGTGVSNAISGEAIASQRTGTGNLYGLDFYTQYAKRMSIDNSGNVSVVGNLTKGGGSFKIDDPIDPENRYLYHSFVESPDMMNIYNGNVILDEHGEAVVQLPKWFEALNQDFRYQLTCLHGFAPVYIDEEISENHFKIAGGKPGMKVSWQVTGIRHDPYANAHRIRVEEEKPAEERGTYLHPAEYGQPPERSH